MNNLRFDFSSRKVLVVGGSKGIGREVCNQFLKSGSRVYSAARSDCDIKGVENINCDIANPTEIERLFSIVNDIDFCINSVGTNLCKPIEYISLAEWDRVMNINLRSIYLVCKKTVEIMKQNGGGRIVNISSIAGRSKSLVSGVHYTSSKYGVIGLTKQLAAEVAAYNILVNCVCPSQTYTEMLEESMNKEQLEKLVKSIPIGRISSTLEQALPILFLCSDAASYITGAAIDINGGQL